MWSSAVSHHPFDARSSLLDAQRWTTLAVSDARPFWSPAIAPDRTIATILQEGLVSDPEYNSESLWSEILLSCSQVATRRRDALRALPRAAGSSGRVLLYDPRWTTHDGLAADTGLFDTALVPAWDSWVCVVRTSDPASLRAFDSALVAWIPDQVAHVAAHVVADLDIAGCLEWADADAVRGSHAVAELVKLGVLGS